MMDDETDVPDGAAEVMAVTEVAAEETEDPEDGATCAEIE